jgi:hypothetical protein
VFVFNVANLPRGRFEGDWVLERLSVVNSLICASPNPHTVNTLLTHPAAWVAVGAGLDSVAKAEGRSL